MMPSGSLYASPYDERLATIGHYSCYPNLMPWVGVDYPEQDRKILVLGESHYLKTGTIHHDDAAWYTGIDPARFANFGWAHTRNLIGNGVDIQWRGKGRGKVMYRHIDAVLRESEDALHGTRAAFHRIAYMNYFQRPAEKAGQSIRVTALDRMRSAAVLKDVIRIIEPSLVIFCSRLAWRAAEREQVMDFMQLAGIHFAFTAHPTTSWWNRPMAKYDRMTGRDQFLRAVRGASVTALSNNQPSLLSNLHDHDSAA